METTYKGVTKVISDKLLEPIKVIRNPPVKSYKFDTVSLYYDGKYYFMGDLKKHNSDNHFKDKDFKIEVVYYQGKWYQDTFYITTEFANFLKKYQ